MIPLSPCQLKRLETELFKATTSGICRWQTLMPECVHVNVGEYGIFITKFAHYALLNIYRNNQGCVVDRRVYNFNTLFDRALKQSSAKEQLRGRDLLERNSNILEINAQKHALQIRICKVLHQP